MENKIATIWVSSAFRAYHYHGGALNEEKHSHDFKYKIFLKGPLNAEGFLVDFRKVENLLNTINAHLENKVLNKIIPPATTEILAIYLFEEIKKTFPQICRIELNEKENYGAVYEE